MQSSPKSATRPMRKASSPGPGNFPSEMENGWENQQESVRGVCNTAGIHPQWPCLRLGLSPLQLKGGNAQFFCQVQQCHQHFCLFNSILMEGFFLLLKLCLSLFLRCHVESIHIPRKRDLSEAIAYLLVLEITSLPFMVGEHLSVFPILCDNKTKLLCKHTLQDSSELWC